jgi:3-oxoacyl-[acyl-carrier protein] reductase
LLTRQKEEGKMTSVLSKFTLKDKVAIITGCGQGIGKSIALNFAGAGAHIVVAEINPSTAEATAAEVRRLGRESLAMVTDVTNSNQIGKMVDAALERFGRIDILVNNAGVNLSRTPVVWMSEEEWNKTLAIDLTGVFLCSKAAGRVMVKQGAGVIINIASMAGERAYPGMAAYAAAKAAVINFTQTLAAELARYHIRVNAICPGGIETALGTAAMGTTQERVERAGIPLGRIGYPDDIAAAAIYLASDASDWVTGIVIQVHGGPHTRKGDMEMFIAKFPNLAEQPTT